MVEGNETFTVGLSVSNAPTGVTVTATDTGTGTINSGTGGDQDTATLTINDASASEGDSMTFTVTLSEAVQGGLKVSPIYTHGTTAKNDYSANTTALTFTGTKGETKTFDVSTNEDAVLEANETFTVSMSVSGTTLGNSITSTDTGTGTINNDDSSTVTVNDASASEGNSMTFTVTLSEAVQGGLTVTPDFTDVTATEGTDYDENTTGLSFTGTKGETKTFTVSTDEDAVLEANETFTVGLSISGTSLNLTVSDTGTGTINNDDSAAVTVNDANADEGDGITFTVTLSEAVQGGLKVTPSYTNGTAASGDYTTNTTALTFTGTKGETETFTVSTTEDAVLEANETFTVGLTVSDAPTGTTVTATDTGTGTINNDDGATVTVNDASASEGDGMTFTVTLGAAVQGGLTVTPGYTNGTAASGDYTANTTALSFTGTANETKTFTVSTTEDAVLEANETFTVDLTVSGTSLSVTATDTGTGTINNDDSAAVTVNDANADEGNGIAFTVTLGAAVQGGLKVTPDFTDGTAVEGTDYDENTAALSFTGTANETKTITVSTTEDAVVEGNETFTVGLTVSGTSLSVTATDTGTGTINNDDGAVVTVNNANADEGDDITFTVTLGAAVQGGLTVTPSFTDVTAVEGTDYDEKTTALSFTGTKGETKTITVSTTEDAVLEADETFTVALSSSNSSVTATDTGTGTIDNDDSAAVTINDANADEGQSMTFTVTLDTAVQGGLTVTPSYTDGTATRGTDYTANTTALAFSGTKGETKTITVSTTTDNVFEADETFTVGLRASNAPAGVTATDTGTGTIDNDDIRKPAVTVNDATADEGNSMTFTVTLDMAVQGGLTVTPSYTNGTASDTDYTANTTAISFSGAKDETQTFTVSTTEDAVLEANETFRVGLSVSNAPSGVAATDTGTGTINNDDGAVVTVNDAGAYEGDDMSFRVTLGAAVQGGLTVTPVFTDVTAVEGLDYQESTTKLSFSGKANETKIFAVSTIDDTLLEETETFTVGLTVSGTAHRVDADDTGTGTISDDEADRATLTINDARADEGDSLTFTVSVDKPVPGGFTVTPAYTDGTAVSGLDYTPATAALKFRGGFNERHSFTVPTIEDDEVEPEETFSVALTVSGTTHTLSVGNAGTGTIADDDSAAGDGTGDGAALTISGASAEEGDGLTFTVTVDNAVPGGFTVTAYSDGSAVAGVDYTPETPALRFSGAANERHSFTVSSIEDAEVEPDETFLVGLTVSGTTHTVSAGDTGTGTIVDDDSAPRTAPR